MESVDELAVAMSEYDPFSEVDDCHWIVPV